MDSNSPKKEDLNIDENPLINEIDLKIIFQTLNRKKNLIIKTTFLGIILGGVVTFIQKPTWQGEFQIVVENNSEKGKMGGVLDKFQRGLPNVGGLSLLGNKTDKLETEVEILKSPSVLINVFEFIKKEKNKRNDKTFDNIRFEKWRSSYLSVELTKKTSILNLSYKDKDKDLIIPVLNKISNTYQNYSDKRRVRDIELSLEYFGEQVDIYKEKSKNSNAMAQKFALIQDLTFTSIINSSMNDSPMGPSNNAPRTLDVEKRRLKAVNDLKILNSQMRKLKDADTESNDILGFASSINLPSTLDLVTAISDLEIKLSDLRIYYNDNDTSIKNIIEKKKDFSADLKKKLLSILKGQIIEAESRLKASERPMDILVKYNELLSEASRDKKILDNLENNYRKTQLEKARTRDPWELITQPTILPKPVEPKKSINILIGFLLGFGSGIITAFILNRREGVIHTSDETKFMLDIPFLSEIYINKDEQVEESIYLLSNGAISNAESIAFLLVGIDEKMISNKFSTLLKKYFGKANFKLTNNITEAINYKNIIFIFALGKTKKAEIIELKKKLEYQKILKIGYINIKDIF
mgnify:CR=1 FL=1